MIMDKHLDAEALGDYAEGVPDARARAAMEAHLAGCARCRGDLAAIQAYFRGMADLEPARAPADFLAKVRARLPRPSPWARAWAALFLPFRSIPVPIAVGLIIGVTAITVYMRQGGPATRTEVPAPPPAPSSAAPSSASPSSGSAPEFASGSPSDAASQASSEIASGSAGPAADRNEPIASRPGLKDVAPEIVGSAPAAPAASAALRRKSVSRSAREAPKASIPPIAPQPEPPPAEAKEEKAAEPAKPAPTASRSPAPDRARDLRDAETLGWLDSPSPAYIRGNSGSRSPDDLPLDKAMPLEEESAVPGQAEAAAGHASAHRAEKEKRPEGLADVQADGKADRKADGLDRAAPTKKAAPAPLPSAGYVLSLRTRSDTAAVLAGLRSMGVEAEPDYASPAECRFRLSVPAPMLRELGPYLARHGESRPEGRLPSAASGTAATLRLRLILPLR
jgi:hypothetical protein